MGEAEKGASAVYDIFINHRGPDTKKTVASLIYRDLIKYGLRVFLDQDELEPGDKLDPAIKSAISTSSVHIAIFSCRYAESFWCLNELLDMLQSGCRVISIFYDVKPADLRHIEKGRYANAFRDHQNKGRHNVELVEKCKVALQEASGISGIVLNSKEDDLASLVDEIVEKVLKEAKWAQLHVADQPVGLHEATEDFSTFLIQERQLSCTTVVGIVGLDGSGKSTLVKQLYNCYLQSREFKRYCFLSQLDEKDLAVLQQNLVRDLSDDDKYISDTTKGKTRLQRCLRGCGPVLIVLDGVDKAEQIETLLSVVKKDVLAEGSLILVTCHNKALLKAHQVNLFYPVNLLQGKEAHNLFCWYAFGSPEHPFDQPEHSFDPLNPPKHLGDLVVNFLEICGGFPLALKILGRKLYGQDRRYWEEQLKELRRPELPTEIVEKILKVSYNYLEEREKEIFLDVAHFLVGEETDLAVRVLEGLHDNGFKWLKDLQSKCLLDLEEIEHCKRPFAKGSDIQYRTKGSSKVRMHD